MSVGLEVADIFRRHGEEYRQVHDGHLGRVERRVMSAIELCRTAELGGHVEGCRSCGAIRVAYNSCRNRHCPKCQGQACRDWLAAREAELLPVPYFHVVFTLPAEVAAIAFQNKTAVYTILFKAAAETLRTIAADRRHLGAEIGLIVVLHSWGQTLTYHPHLHCIVPGGGVSPDGTRWISCRPGFFLPVRVLSRLFRRRFLEELRVAHDAGRLGFFGDLAHLAKPDAFARLLAEVRRLEWVVYAKPPFGGPQQVLAYLGRYTHRVAIANSRLVSMADDRVAFRWRDYRHGARTKVMALDAHEFIRRFLLHTLPDGFHRIRHYGFLANGHRAARLGLCRRLLASQLQNNLEPSAESAVVAAERLVLTHRCPCCGGAMVTLATWRCGQAPPSSFWNDTS
ncbi:IS91 family transposase [Mesorhizobium sp. SARCC-RB16n]|uniref:IS91 family transposase n=1 Tax=Mesorhizobium sp. SARCC-RB16n TaxID=2116687 RepID=UPI00122EA774|nr:IS91 family transposase [Mesorhizobium sp. SARCC-RB16n]KAA3447922.1 IS91 family transposase [Mesorhizobium sp. SARCC-RB16n]